MKKILLVLLMLAPVALFAQQKFGVINSTIIAQAMPEYAKAQTDLQTLQKQYGDEYNRMREEFAKKYEDYTKAKDSLPANILQRREQELQDLQTRLEEYQQDSYQRLQEAQAQKMEEVKKKLTDAIQAVGTEGSYLCIFDKSGGVAYISETQCEDVTAKVKTKLGIK